MGDDGIFDGHLVHFTVFFIFYGYIFGIVHDNLVYFSRFGILYQEKSGNQPCLKAIFLLERP
jgi:hypothetical protein